MSSDIPRERINELMHFLEKGKSMRAVKQIVAWGEKLYALTEDGKIWSRETDNGESAAYWDRIPGPPAEHNAKQLSESKELLGHIEPDRDPIYGGPRSS